MRSVAAAGQLGSLVLFCLHRGGGGARRVGAKGAEHGVGGEAGVFGGAGAVGAVALRCRTSVPRGAGVGGSVVRLKEGLGLDLGDDCAGVGQAIRRVDEPGGTRRAAIRQEASVEGRRDDERDNYRVEKGPSYTLAGLPGR